MPTPSLLIVPARFKTGKLYSQIPTSGAGDFTVTRNTEARRFDSAGLVASVASGIPRLDYYTSGGVTGCPALLVEPAGTNLAFNSQTWAAANNWGLDGVTTVTATSGTTAPDGTSTANAISPTSGNVFHGLYSNSPTQYTYISGTIYTQSAFFKAGGTNLPVSGSAGRYVQLTYTGGGQFTQNGYANFDLQLGTVAVVSGTSADTNRAARIENYGNGWYRCSFTATCNAAGNGVGVLPVLVNASGNTRAQSFSGTVTDVIYGWGAQLETGSVATSYIPTTTGTGSRSADVISVSGAVSGSIGQTEGTLYAEIVAQPYNNASFPAILQVDDGADSQRFAIFIHASGGIRVRLNASGINLGIDSTNPATLVVGQTYKIAAAFGFNGSQALYINGVFQVSGSVTAGPFTAALNRVMLGHRGGISSPFLIRSAALYTTRLTNAELATLTAP